MNKFCLGLLVALLTGVGSAAAAPQSSQSGTKPKQEPSLAEVARKVRQQKEGAPKAEHVWTNDNLPSGAPVSTVGTPLPESAGGAEAGTRGPASAEEEKERGETEAELSQAKEELTVLKKDLDLLNREYDLQRQQFYSNPGYASDSAGQAALDALDARKSQKQQEVQDAEAKVQQLETKLKELNETLGPKETPPPTEAERREDWAAKLRPLREELAKVEAELNRIRSEAAAAGETVYSPTVGASMTADMIARLEQRRSELQQQIAAVEDDARRAGVPPAWLR